MHVPWAAIWGVRSVGHRHGWLGPKDVPEVMRRHVAIPNDVWQRMLETDRVAMVPVPPPLVLLSPPKPRTPRQAVQHCRRHGAAIILVDAQADGVTEPRGLEA